MTCLTKYTTAMESVFDKLRKADALKDFRKAMMSRAEWISRDLTSIPDTDDRVSLVLRGALTICFELADGAKSALEGGNEEANSSTDQEIQTE